MVKKKWTLLLVLALVISVSFSSVAFAAEDEYECVNVKYGKTYVISSDHDEAYLAEVVVPAKGTITMHAEFDNKESATCFGMDVINSNEEEVNYLWVKGKYDSKKGMYTGSGSVSLSKGTYELFGGSPYPGKVRYYISYRPALGKTRITKLTAKRKGFTVKYKKASYASGYQIRYSTSSKMTNAKSIKTTKLYRTISKLKAKKRYYIQVRSYKKMKVDGVMKTFYSEWSAKKYVRTR